MYPVHSLRFIRKHFNRKMHYCTMGALNKNIAALTFAVPLQLPHRIESTNWQHGGCKLQLESRYVS